MLTLRTRQLTLELWVPWRLIRTMEIQEEIAADMKRIRADLSDIKEVLPAMLQDLDVMEQCTRE